MPVTDADATHGHVPVMPGRVIELLGPGVRAARAAGVRPVVVDGTLGAGGHAFRILEAFADAILVGIDRDAAALAESGERLARYEDRFRPIRARFDEAFDRVDAIAPSGIAGALFDLGVSSMQLDRVDRGFAYRVDGPLDMRMDTRSGLTAADILNTFSHADLTRLLRDYGDERFAGRIAAAVVRRREQEPFRTSRALVQLLYETIPAAARRTGGHPAKRTFQALRCAVNGELEAIRRVLPQVTARLRVGARAVFMSYQSHEDKLVKAHFRGLVTSSTPPGLPVDLPGTQPHFVLVTRGAEKADAEEIDSNPRAASVRVRAIERISTKSAPNSPRRDSAK